MNNGVNNKLSLDSIFCDGVVLRRECVNRVWGKSPCYPVVRLDGSECTVSFADGRFMALLPAIEASTDHTIDIECDGQYIKVKDVAFGDVYLLSGQSNMQLPVSRVMDVSGSEALAADFPDIRHFTVEPRYIFGQTADDIPNGVWRKAVWPDVGSFSAAGFFCARRMYLEKHIPIGLVLNAMGGSSIEAWISEKLFAECGGDISKIEPYKCADGCSAQVRREEAAFADWLGALKVGSGLPEDTIPADAEPFTVPSMSFGTALDGYSGSVWFYREVKLSVRPEGKGLIYIGNIIDSDTVYINGVKVGETGYRYPPRKYDIPHGVLRQGSNIIAVRVVINNAVGGFVAEHPYYLDSGAERVDISGEWRMKKESTAAPANEVLFPPKLPTGLYNASLYPLRNMRFSAVLWYQGESNADHPEGYGEMFAAMIAEWRALFGEKLPVVCVELCDYDDPAVEVQDYTGWNRIQQYQLTAPQSVELCAVARAKDLGAPLELHPQRKQELGERMAEALMSITE